MEVPSRQVQCILGGHIQAGQPEPGLVLAPLCDRIGEEVELGQRPVELQPQEREPPLLFGGRCALPGPAQPPDVTADLRSELASPEDQVLLDARLRRG